MAGHGRSSAHEGLRYYFEVACTLSRRDAIMFLKLECETNALYEEAWEEAERLYGRRREEHPSHPWNAMKKEYFVAVMCYMLKRPDISSRFNKWCRAAMPTEESWQCFPLKSLFFFLIKAFRYLPPHHVAQVYRADPRFTVVKKNKVPFVQFLSASANLHQTTKFGSQLYTLVLLDIPPALLRDVSMYSSFPHYSEVIIWPFCVFSFVAEENVKKILVFDPKRSWAEPRLLMTPGIARPSSLVPTTSTMRRGDEPSTSGAVSDAGSPELPKISKPQCASSLDAASAERATDHGEEESEPAARNTEASAPRPGARETPLPGQTTCASARHLRKIIHEVRRELGITIPRHLRTDTSGKNPGSGAPRQVGDTRRSVSSSGSLAAGGARAKSGNEERSRQAALSVADDTDDVAKWKAIAAVVSMAVIFASSVILIQNKFVF